MHAKVSALVYVITKADAEKKFNLGDFRRMLEMALSYIQGRGVAEAVAGNPFGTMQVV